MSGEKSEVERLVELLAEEKTWQGRYFGHKGQAEVAQTEVEYCFRVLSDEEITIDDEARRYWERKREKAIARREYHLKQAQEARKKLEEIRAEIRKITRRRRI